MYLVCIVSHAQFKTRRAVSLLSHWNQNVWNFNSVQLLDDEISNFLFVVFNQDLVQGSGDAWEGWNLVRLASEEKGRSEDQ